MKLYLHIINIFERDYIYTHIKYVVLSHSVVSDSLQPLGL